MSVFSGHVNLTKLVNSDQIKPQQNFQLIKYSINISGLHCKFDIYVTQSRGMSHGSALFNFDFST